LPELSVHTLGYAAGFLTTVSCVPQVLKSWRSRSVHDLSLLMLVLLLVGLVCWVVYGLQVNDGPILITNGASFVLWASVLWLKLRNPR